MSGEIPNDADCDHCETRAVRMTCHECGVSAMITDCGCNVQPRPIAADGMWAICEECADARK